MRLKATFLSNTALCTSVVLTLGAQPAPAADFGAVEEVADAVMNDLPAVSGVNGKLAIAGGGTTPGLDISGFSNDFEGSIWGEGAITVPLGHRFGLQADGVAASIQDELFAHGAAHLFWRNPSRALVGAYGAYSTWDDLDRWRVGFETEGYFGRLSLEGLHGYEFGDVEDDFFSISDLALYVTDDFRLSVGHRYSGPGHMLTAGVEYQVRSGPNAGWAVYADGRVGENDYQAIFAGVRLYFGQDKSLIRRHREDDPRIKTDAFSFTGCTEKKKGVLAADGVFDAQVLAVDSGFIDSIVDSSAGSEEVLCGEDFKIVDQIPSDARLKRDIRKMGTLASGLNVYEFKYAGDTQAFVGLMAQEVLAHETAKAAVVLGPGGYLAVDYGSLGLRMATLGEWRERGLVALIA